MKLWTVYLFIKSSTANLFVVVVVVVVAGNVPPVTTLHL